MLVPFDSILRLARRIFVLSYKKKLKKYIFIILLNKKIYIVNTKNMLKKKRTLTSLEAEIIKSYTHWGFFCLLFLLNNSGPLLLLSAKIAARGIRKKYQVPSYTLQGVVYRFCIRLNFS